MNTSIFKAYDIRGIYPTDVNPAVITVIGKVCARMFEAGRVVVAHDVRYGSSELAQIIEASILEEAKLLRKKIEVISVGSATTPMFYFLVNHFKASGGCMITASHNPKNYNGLKIVGPGASMIQGTMILELIKKYGLQ